MTGLSVLYTYVDKDDAEWSSIPDRDKAGWLRERYWAYRRPPQHKQKQFVEWQAKWNLARDQIGRKHDDPGDQFMLFFNSNAPNDIGPEWCEVTEVFTTVPAQCINDAMCAWHGFPRKRSIDFGDFRKRLKLERPSRLQQRVAADRVIRQVKKKLLKSSYHELMEKYGYGTLVVGLPLWFATFPDDPFRVENALDDFMTRLGLGLEDLKQSTLKKLNCPFKSIRITWDITPQAFDAWNSKQSPNYKEIAASNFENGIGLSFLSVMSDSLGQGMRDKGILESAMPSIISHCCDVTVQKKLPYYENFNKGPYPPFAELLRREMDKNRVKGFERFRMMVRGKFAQIFCKLLCVLNLYGINGLQRGIIRKISISHKLRFWLIQQKMKRLYCESKRRGRSFQTVFPN
ncbi:MAG: hypothetical protein OXC68_09650 [Aestuariivita sp.]|nr:hypothetical protein [Aestuariivita sp.]